MGGDDKMTSLIPKGVKNCLNCGFVEFDTARRRKDSEYYCTNCNAKKCFEFVTESDCCPMWILYTASTRLISASY